jgi:hypothetical protein
MYSFKKRKKYHTNSIAVIKTVKIPMETAPHLIGKHPQHEDSLVNSLAQTQSQQQHGSKSGLAYGSSSSFFFSSSAGFCEDFLLPDFFEPCDLAPWDLASAPSAASSAGASSPPSNRLSYSLYR